MQHDRAEHRYDAIILGAGLTGLTLAYLLGQHQQRVLVLERQGRTGGQIYTKAERGFVFETGPNTGILSNLAIEDLFHRLGSSSPLELAKPTAKRRLILKHGQFCPLPSGARSAFATPLFSWRDKLRIFAEPFRTKGQDPNESIAQLVRRRLGRTYLTYAVDPFVGGIYAGDPDALVTRHALPRLYALEQQHGSFIRGAIAKMRQPSTSKTPSKGVFSCRGGLSSLTDTLARAIGPSSLRLGVSRLDLATKTGDGWAVTYEQGGHTTSVYAPYVVSTLDTVGIETCIPFLSEEHLTPIRALRYAPIVQVALGYRDARAIKFEAFGGLVPSVEDKELLGILNPSACFSGRAPEGGILLSLFLGGMRSPEVIDLTDHAIEQMVRSRLERILGITAEPDLIHIARHPRAIPQYERSTDERLAAINTIEQTYRGLHLAGSLRDGIGMADRIAQAYTIAEQLLGSKLLE